MKKLFLVCMLLSLTGRSQLGLLASYSFTGNANDDSGNGHNGTVVNAVLTADRFGNSNNAYYFNGVNSYIDIGQGFGYSSYSFAGWAKKDTSSPAGTNILISKLNNGPHDLKNGELEINGHTAGTGSVWGYVASTGSYNSGDSTWVHVVGTYNDSTKQLKIYQNGHVDSSTISGYVDITTTPIYIGARPFWSGTNSTTFFFKGSLDDFYIYDYALSQAEVDSLYYLGNPTTSIHSIKAESKILRKEYYNLQGVKLSEPVQGLYIEVIFYENGKAERRKLFRQE